MGGMEPTSKTNLPARVWRALQPDPETGCWLWQNSCGAAGYGQVMVDRKMWRVHRLIYIDQVGAIPDGLVLDHLCRVRHCANPDHLEPVTQYENVVVRGRGPCAEHAAASACVNGHPFTPENTSVNSLGHRACKTCRRDHYHANKARLNAQRLSRVACEVCGKDLARASRAKHRQLVHGQPDGKALAQQIT